VAFADLERSTAPGLLGHSQETRADHLRLMMVFCLLVNRLTEYRLRARLAEIEQTIPDQVHKPTVRPTLRWIFQCFEGIALLTSTLPLVRTLSFYAFGPFIGRS
jgi:transposase